MLRCHRRLLRYNIVTRVLDMHPKQAYHPARSVHPVVGLRKQKLGACILNKPNNQNIISEECADELFRFFTSYHHQQAIENVYLQSKHGYFSSGLDFRSLYFSPNYLDKIFDLTMLLAKTNKPIFTQVAGGVRNIAAYILSATAAPLAYKNANMCIDETVRGFIPICGGSHRLAALPLHMGMYLALTGETLDSDEMSRLGFLKGFIREGVSNEDIMRHMSDSNKLFSQIIKVGANDTEYLEGIKYRRMLHHRALFKLNDESRQSVLLNNPEHDLLGKFAYLQYNRARFDYENAKTPYSSFSDKPYYKIHNYFAVRTHRPLNYLIKNNLVELSDMPHFRLPRFNVAEIDFIFGQPTFDSLLKQLRLNPSQWAREALKKITQNNQLVNRLTFELIKRAENLAWTDCRKMEYLVARRLLAVSKIETKDTAEGSVNIFTNKLGSLPANKLQECAETFFEPASLHTEVLKEDLPRKSLVPVVDHYKELPDSVRVYLNREDYVDRNAPNFKREISRFLDANKIDYRNQQFDINILRERTHDRQVMTQHILKEAERCEHLAFNSTALDYYSSKRLHYLHSISTNLLQQKINQEIQYQFQANFDRRTDGFKPTAVLAGLENRKDLFRNARSILLGNTLFRGYEIQKKWSTREHFQGPIYFDSQGKGVYDSVNPYIQSDSAANSLAYDIATIGVPSDNFFEQDGKELTPQSIGAPNEKQEYELIRDKYLKEAAWRYAPKLGQIAEMETDKQLFKRAGNTSEQLGFLLEWDYQHIQCIRKEIQGRDYGDFAMDVSKSIIKELEVEKDLLKEVILKDKELKEAGVNPTSPLASESLSQIRQKFPYYFDDTVLPPIFKKTFLRVLDATINHFTQKQVSSGDRLSFLGGELGEIDKWVNGNIGANYTDKLKADVEYVSSYIGILLAKELIFRFVQMRKIPQIDWAKKFGKIIPAQKEQESEIFKRKSLMIIAQQMAAAGISLEIENGDFKVDDLLHEDNQIEQILPQEQITALRLSIQKQLDQDQSALFEEFDVKFLEKEVIEPIELKKAMEKIGKNISVANQLYATKMKTYLERKQDFGQLYQKISKQMPPTRVKKRSAAQIESLARQFILMKRYRVRFEMQRVLVFMQFEYQLTQFLNAMMDIHSEMKSHIVSPQAKILDFLNRLRIGMQKKSTLLPASFESLALMISKDRRKIYDQFYNTPHTSEPELALSLSYRSIRGEFGKINTVKTYADQKQTKKLIRYMVENSFHPTPARKRLVNNFPYYIMKYDQLFSKACANDHFLPINYNNSNQKPLLDYLKSLVPAIPNQDWLKKQIKTFVAILLRERFQAEKKMSKGELISLDARSISLYQASTFVEFVTIRLEQEKQIVKDLGAPAKKFTYKLKPEQIHQEQYNRARREIKNEGALRRANNMAKSDNIRLQYAIGVQNRSLQGKELQNYIEEIALFPANPFNRKMSTHTYRRLEREVKKYPEELASMDYMTDDPQSFKRSNLVFKKEERPQKPVLTVFTDEYVTLQETIKDKMLEEIIVRLKTVDSL